MKSGVLSRHRHAGPVRAIPLSSRWCSLERDWEAVPGSGAFEPPGETHTLIVSDDADVMVSLFHMTGGYVHVAGAHFDATGFRAAHAERLMQ